MDWFWKKVNLDEIQTWIRFLSSYLDLCGGHVVRCGMEPLDGVNHTSVVDLALKNHLPKETKFNHMRIVWLKFSLSKIFQSWRTLKFKDYLLYFYSYSKDFYLIQRFMKLDVSNISCCLEKWRLHHKIWHNFRSEIFSLKAAVIEFVTFAFKQFCHTQPN